MDSGEHSDDLSAAASGLAARLDGADASTRNYALHNLPLHLDAADDAYSAQRLIRLARDGFPKLKAERTLDVPLSNHDYRYYFRATLRARDLPAALQLARSRAGLSHLTDWLASGVLAGILPHLGRDSRLWSQICRAIASLESATLRVETLTEFLQSGLDPSMYAWMRRQFDDGAAFARDSARTDFLAGIATHEAGAINYVLDRAASAPVSAAFVRALLEHLNELCAGTAVTPDEALSRIAALVRSHGEALVEGADVLAAMRERSAAMRGLSAFEAVLPGPGGSPEALLCTAAVSRGWAAQGELRKAEALARRCLNLVPPLPTDPVRRLLYASSYVDAAGRLLLAAAPFADVWTEAVPIATHLAARGSARIHRSEALARFLGVVPWMADPAQRLDWLRETLASIGEFVASDLDSDPIDPLDLAVFGATRALDGDSPRLQLSRPIQGALDDVLDHIDQVLPSARELQPLHDLISTAIAVRSRLGEGAEAVAGLFEWMLASAAHSTSVHVRIVVAGVFFRMTSEEPTVDAAVVLAGALSPLVAGVDEPSARMLATGLLKSADRAWCQDRPEMCSALAHAALAAAVGGRHQVLFEAADAHLPAWIQRGDPDEATGLIVAWAAARVVFGRVYEARRMLAGVETLDRRTRLEVARVLLDGGAPEAATQLLDSDLPEAGATADPELLEETLEVARLLMLANGDDRARECLLRAVFEYRGGIGETDGSTEGVLLNAVRDVKDDAIVSRLLARAETELLQAAEADADLAARWYVTAALSASGNADAAKRAWGQITRWKSRRLAMAARGRTFELLGDPASASAAERLLDAIDAILVPRDAEEALLRACRLLGRLDGDVRLLLVEGIGEAAEAFTGNGTIAEPVLTGLCDALTEIPDGAAARSGIGCVIDAVSRLPPVDRQGDGTGVVAALFRAMRAHAVDPGSRSQALLARLCHPHAGAVEVRLFREMLDMGADIRLALRAADDVTPTRERWGFLIAVAERARRQQDAALLDEAVARLIAIFDGLEDLAPWDAVRLSELFAACHAVASPDLAATVAARLRSIGPPATAGARVEWASNLTGTPLEPVAAAPLAALEEDLDRFAVRPEDLRSLSAFLRRVMPRDPHAAAAFFERVAYWATSMPLVTNEDWRHEAFIQIVDAAGDLDPSVRSAAQRNALERGFASLGQHESARRHLAEALVSLPLDSDTARWALAEWLTVTHASPQRSIDDVVDLLVSSLEYREGKATGAVLDAYLASMADGYPTSLNREAAARTACETTFVPLRERLGRILLHDYDVKGVGMLERWDLAFLASMSLTWWVDRSTLIGVRAADGRWLREWVECVVRPSPESAWWSVVLATEWLSRSDPQVVGDFWFELCTLSSWFPEDIRLAILRCVAPANP